MNVIFGKTGFYAFDSTLHITYNGLIGFKKIDFNTVDGFIYRQTFSLELKDRFCTQIENRSGNCLCVQPQSRHVVDRYKL